MRLRTVTAALAGGALAAATLPAVTANALPAPGLTLELVGTYPVARRHVHSPRSEDGLWT